MKSIGRSPRLNTSTKEARGQLSVSASKEERQRSSFRITASRSASAPRKKFGMRMTRRFGYASNTESDR